MTALQLARALAVPVTIEDLGDCGVAELRAEYDPEGPTIRVNERFLTSATSPDERKRRLNLAVAHELYHHAERCGTVRRLAKRSDREAAANAFAHQLMEDAF